MAIKNTIRGPRSVSASFIMTHTEEGQEIYRRMFMQNLMNSVPPKELMYDDLIGTFGAREQELAVLVIIVKAVQSGTWNITVTENDFETDRDGYVKDGFHMLIKHEWLIPTNEQGTYGISSALVKRLRKDRGSYFK